VFFSSFIIKIPKSSKRQSIEKGREKKVLKKGRKIKAPWVSANKKGKSIFWEEKNISTSKSFYVNLFPPPPSFIPFSKPFPNSFEKVS
jgi:hypothetical protein